MRRPTAAGCIPVPLPRQRFSWLAGPQRGSWGGSAATRHLGLETEDPPRSITPDGQVARPSGTPGPHVASPPWRRDATEPSRLCDASNSRPGASGNTGAAQRWWCRSTSVTNYCGCPPPPGQRQTAPPGWCVIQNRHPGISGGQPHLPPPNPKSSISFFLPPGPSGRRLLYFLDHGVHRVNGKPPRHPLPQGIRPAEPTSRRAASTRRGSAASSAFCPL